jgi:hypothetical protein
VFTRTADQEPSSVPGGVRAAHGTVTATGIARSDEQSKFPQGAADAKKTGRDLLHPPYDAFVSTGAACATQMLEIVRHAVGQGAWHCTVHLVYGVLHGLVLPVWRGDGI